MFKYGIYCRKSTEDKIDSEKSLADQEVILKALAEKNELNIVAAHIYKESMSAKTPYVRPLYDNLLKALRSGEIDGILTWNVNRLSRNMAEGGLLSHELTTGVIKEIRTPHALYRSEDDIMPLVIEACMSTKYSLDLSKAVRRGMRSKFESGGWSHKALPGYMNIRDPRNSKKGLIVIDEEQFYLMRKGWDMLLTGAYNVLQIIDTLNNVYGFRTRPTRKYAGGPLNRASAYKLFSNPFYAGFIVEKGDQRKGTHQAMIDVEEFNRAQNIIKKLMPTKAKQPRPYSGLIRCAYCNLQVTCEQHTMRNGKPYISYRCSDSRRQCTKQGISEVKLEEQITTALESITVEQGLCEIALKNILRWLGEESNHNESNFAQQQNKLVELEEQHNRLMDMWLNGLITDRAQYKLKECEILEQKSTLQLAADESRQEMAHIRQQAIQGFNYVKFARDNFMVAPPDKKREIAASLGISYKLHGREKVLEIELHPSLAAIVKFSKAVEEAIEPAKIALPTDSDKEKSTAFGDALFFGRRERI